MSEVTPTRRIDATRALVAKAFAGTRACLFQLEAAISVYTGHDTVLCAGTGSGKTLSFWIPLLMALDDGLDAPITILVTPLNILGQENAKELGLAGIAAVAINSETSSQQLWTCIHAAASIIIATKQ
ncbi:hypothetical protein BDN71DRAFT_1495271 [Pleurotus eryngii]|uniref:Helicase ATP-binding domain-containing protein n=1 Tax=Pleurotus eryngii TaxID=5323 RepID=A0A9P6DHH5_PLEER|nr:hypothetical protein BDN71DRAFT_1495271 [Pleurotus eryngii]